MATNKKLSAVIQIGGSVAGSLKSAFGTVDGALGKLGKTVTELEKKQKDLARSIRNFRAAGKNVDELRKSYGKLSEQIELAYKANERFAKAQARANKIAGFAKGAGTAIA